MTTQNPQAVVVMQEDAYCDNANMFFVQLQEITDDKLYAMAAIINSTPFAYFAKSIANPQQGGFYKFNKQFLDPVPFPCKEFREFSEISDYSIFLNLFNLFNLPKLLTILYRQKKPSQLGRLYYYDKFQKPYYLPI